MRAGVLAAPTLILAGILAACGGPAQTGTEPETAGVDASITVAAVESTPATAAPTGSAGTIQVALGQSSPAVGDDGSTTTTTAGDGSTSSTPTSSTTTSSIPPSTAATSTTTAASTTAVTSASTTSTTRPTTTTTRATTTTTRVTTTTQRTTTTRRTTTTTTRPSTESRPEILALAVPMHGGGTFDPATVAGEDVLLWFWGPH